MNDKQKEQMNRIKQRREQAERNSRERAMRREREAEKACQAELRRSERTTNILAIIFAVLISILAIPVGFVFGLIQLVLSIAMMLISLCLTNRYFALIAITVIFVLLKINQ